MLSIHCDRKRTIATYTPVPLVIMKESFEISKDMQLNKKKRKREKRIIKKKSNSNIHYHHYHFKFDWLTFFLNFILPTKLDILMNKIYLRSYY